MTASTKTVPLTIPLAIAANGSSDTRDSLTVRQPRTKHVKQLASLLGTDLVEALMSEGGDNVDITSRVAKMLPSLLTTSSLDGITSILADLAGITSAEFDELDPRDAFEVGRVAMAFFPALQSSGSTNTPQTSPSTTVAH